MAASMAQLRCACHASTPRWVGHGAQACSRSHIPEPHCPVLKFPSACDGSQPRMHALDATGHASARPHRHQAAPWGRRQCGMAHGACRRSAPRRVITFKHVAYASASRIRQPCEGQRRQSRARAAWGRSELAEMSVPPPAAAPRSAHSSAITASVCATSTCSSRPLAACPPARLRLQPFTAPTRLAVRIAL